MTGARRNADLTVPLACIAATDLALVGGKAVNLGMLLQAGFDVPDGCCVTTTAFRHFMADASGEVHDRLAGLDPDDIAGVRRAGRDVRTRLAAVSLPGDVAGAVTEAWAQLGTDLVYAVRSSATAEDLPSASFAGQQDTYLGVRGHEPLLAAVRDCFASLFTDRAIGYRLRRGIDDRDVALAVIVQRMVAPEVSGVVFTADPASGDRTVAAIDASYGLGEATVSGVVSPDAIRVDRRTGRVISSTVADKRIAIHARPDGGTHRVDVPDELRRRPALSDARAVALARLAGAVEACFGSPQDIEWALVDDRFVVTQSRPITTLFPLPEPRPDDDALHAYVSFGHVQVMTDPMPPLATSLWRVLVPVGRDGPDGAGRYVATAGSRVYLDVSAALRHPVVGRIVPRAVRIGDQLVAAALGELARRRRFRARGRRMRLRAIAPTVAPVVAQALRVLVSGAPEGTAHAMLDVIDRSVATVAAAVDDQPDDAGRLDVCDAALRRFFDVPLRWIPHFVAGALAQVALGPLVPGADRATIRAAVGRGAPGNVVTEMDLAIGDLAQLARTAELLDVLADTDRTERARLAAVARRDGGEAFLAAWTSFLQRYGARGPSEIDISRPRWADDPTPLLQMVCGVARHGDPGAHRARHEALRAEGIAAGRQLAAAARSGPLGRPRAAVVAHLVHVARHLLPLREHHKYLLVRILGLVRRVVCEAGVSLQGQGALASPDDVWFLTWPELRRMARRGGDRLHDRVTARRTAFERDHDRTPPRVMTSDGEVVTHHLVGADAPEGALVGSPVSSGVVEGTARVVLDPATAELRPGDVLVAPFTDPGWTPLFVTAAALVTEVGGLMTHGSLVAREYGIPAVVGVVDVTRRIETGQRVRVDGDAGYVELLDAPDATADAS